MRSPALLLCCALVTAISAQTDRIRVYFNQDTDPSVSSGTLAISLHNAMDDTIEAYIDRAQATLDVAVYNADDLSIMYALNAAQARGVQVRYITEGSNSNNGLSSLSPLIPVLQRSDDEGSGMHHKFMSIDADMPDQAWVWTGSTNWTQNGLFADYNNMVFVQDQALALAYRAEFEEMWGGSGPQPDAANSHFGADKVDDTPHFFDVDGVQIECRFSPSDGTTSRIVSMLDQAQHSARAALFSFTNDDIADALLDAHERPGCVVQLDLEDAIYPGTEGWYLFSNGVDVATHNSDDPQLHHKYGIVDEGTGSDAVVITGSHNWTWNAELVNDENTLIIHDATVANLFYQEWRARRSGVVGLPENSATTGLRLAPSIASDRISISGALGGELFVLDGTGRCVRRVSTVRDRYELDVRDLPPGLYSAVLIAGVARERRPFVVVR